MNCEEVKQQIELYVLGELSGPERHEIETHLADCPGCHEIDADYRQLVTDLRRSGQTERPGVDFERKILRSAEKEIRATTPRAAVRRVAAVAVATAACLLAGLGLWQLWLRSHAHTEPASADSSAAVQSNVDTYSIPAYARSVPTSVADSIVVWGHDIYLLREDGLRASVAAIDPETGKQKWRSGVESYGYIAADGTRVCCLAPGEEGKVDLVAIDAADGSTMWRYSRETPDPLHRLCAPAVLPEGRICWTANTTIHLLRASDGEVLWTHTIAGESLLSPATAIGDGLYVSGTTGLYYLDIASGQRLWQSEYDFDVSRWSRPLLAVAGEQLCLALRLRTGQSTLVCMNPADRKTIWTKTVPAVSDLCIAGNRLYVRSQDVMALDMESGNLLWNFASTGCSPVTYANGRVWFADSGDQGHLIALDERTGSKMLDLTGIRSCNAFVEIGDKGYVKTHDGAVHVILFEG